MTPDQILVKICFVMDCTASMQPWIHQAKTKTVELVDRVREQNPNTKVLVGFVGYRDYGDQEQFVVVPFQDAKETTVQIRNVNAEGGDDQAEDVAHALHRALHMDWSAAQVKIVFHIADAPAHGEVFHTLRVSDRFPRGDPHGLDPRDSVERMSFSDIDYTFVRINDTTDTMVEHFHNCYGHGGTFSVIDLESQGFARNNRIDDPMGVNEVMSCAVTRSITNYRSSQGL